MKTKAKATGLGSSAVVGIAAVAVYDSTSALAFAEVE